MTSSSSNYVVATGTVTINGTDVGNSPEVVFRQSITTKIRNRIVGGTRYPQRADVVERRGTLSIRLDEWTSTVIGLAKDGASEASVVITQTNDQGPRKTWSFSKVTFPPSDAIPLIGGDGFAEVTLAGEVIFDSSGVWGSVA